MTNRITGLATGLDVDSLVSTELSAYKSKITKQEQEKEILEIQRDMYRDVITQGSDFFNKYLDLTKDNCLISSKTYATTTFSSSNESAISAKAVSGSAIKDNYSVEVEQLASPAKVIIDANSLTNNTMVVNVGTKTVNIDLSSVINSTSNNKNELLTSTLNNQLSTLGLKAVYSQISGGVILETTSEGANQSFKLDGVEHKGENCKYSITNSAGQKLTAESSSNKVTVDNIEFTFNSKTVTKDASGNITASNPITITGKTDASGIVDQISNFFEDFNTMLTNFQTLLKDKHDRDYSPLTEDQKSAMTEAQITKWEAQVKKGQLHNDNLLQSFVSQMKTALSSQTAALKSIGIETVSKYDATAGTYTIDKDKLKSALESDPDKVMNIFMSAGTTTKDASGKETTTGQGALVALKDVLNNNVIYSSKSSLIKKAGLEGNDASATITKQLTTYAKTISKMQSTLATKEQKLYSKYASLETIMNNYNTQLANLQSFFSS